MPASKVQDHAEVKRWLEEGKTYAWIVEQYKEKYDIETTVPMWSAYRRRHGIARRVTRDTDMIPWKIAPKHMLEYPLVMLRAEARRKAGEELKGRAASKLASWKKMLEETSQVVYYDRDTEDGFFYVPREDSDPEGALIRRPSTGLRPQVEE
ncbi:hypothetical protein G6W61_10210 [Streptomyces sp. KAI-26]|uniref:hypothetical protein n=1 Tax=Streptomyces sp. KAI-26 TaxID=1169747 RepID=UPI0015875FD7|nr:hypothetical protein [Streptomyces sp. KAI-26]NUV86580.1 hypothetical protein [Streptomyces sp. KAI-26]NUW21225.1 hypothetical protein [Streptomyces roseoviolaceus]